MMTPRDSTASLKEERTDPDQKKETIDDDWGRLPNNWEVLTRSVRERHARKRDAATSHRVHARILPADGSSSRHTPTAIPHASASRFFPHEVFIESTLISKM